MAFVIDQRNALVKAVVRQRRRELESRVARADDHNGSSHRNSPTESAQETPMTSPLFADVGICPPHPSVTALVSARSRMGALTSRLEAARAPVDRGLNGRSLADFPGIVTCLLLRFKCPPPFPPQ